MRGFFWGILFSAAALVGLMWAGIVNVSFEGKQIVLGNGRPVAFAANRSAEPTRPLPEIRVLDKNEAFAP